MKSLPERRADGSMNDRRCSLSIAHQLLETTAKNFNDIAPRISNIQCFVAVIHGYRLADPSSTVLASCFRNGIWVGRSHSNMEEASSLILIFQAPLGIHFIRALRRGVDEFKYLESDTVPS